MQGALRLHAGVLYVGWYELTASVAAFDLDGRPLETRFTFRDEAAGRSSVEGLDVDDDHRLWVVDGAAARVRCFSLFGREVASVGDETPPGSAPPRDARGELGVPVDVRVSGADDDQVVLVASGGVRRHAVQQLRISSGTGDSLRPLGDPEGRFQRVRSIDVSGETLAVCESGAGRVQLFHGRPGERYRFDFAFEVPEDLGTPEAVSVVGDGRVLVATRGTTSGLHVFDAAGRLRRTIAGGGAETELEEPCAVAIERGVDDRRARVCVLDRDGGRVQVVSLDGRAFGSFVDFGPGPLP